jgi:hypothetical protein
VRQIRSNLRQNRSEVRQIRSRGLQCDGIGVLCDKIGVIRDRIGAASWRGPCPVLRPGFPRGDGARSRKTGVARLPSPLSRLSGGPKPGIDPIEQAPVRTKCDRIGAKVGCGCGAERNGTPPFTTLLTTFTKPKPETGDGVPRGCRRRDPSPGAATGIRHPDPAPGCTNDRWQPESVPGLCRRLRPGEVRAPMEAAICTAVHWTIV